MASDLVASGTRYPGPCGIEPGASNVLTANAEANSDKESWSTSLSNIWQPQKPILPIAIQVVRVCYVVDFWLYVVVWVDWAKKWCRREKRLQDTTKFEVVCLRLGKSFLTGRCDVWRESAVLNRRFPNGTCSQPCHQPCQVTNFGDFRPPLGWERGSVII